MINHTSSRMIEFDSSLWMRSLRNMNPNPTTEVHLRKRSTPYTFVVTLRRGSGFLHLYEGKSYHSALASYWQAVGTLRFVGLSGFVCMELSEGSVHYGAFTTELEDGGI